MIRTLLGGAALVVAMPADAAVFIGTQVVDTRLQGTIAGDAIDASGGDAGVRAGTITAAAQVDERRATGTGDVTLRGVSSVNASLTGSERGRITFRRSLTLDGNGAAADLGSAAGYVYFFSTDAATAFELNWGVSAFGGTAAPAQAALLRDRSSGEQVLSLDALGNGASGSTAVLLAPGSYELRLRDATSPAVGAGVASAGLSSQFSFTMRAVPEPTTWATMLLGFAAAGVMLRRRQPRARRGA